MTRASSPTTIQEAVALLADPDQEAVCVAGCTDLMVQELVSGRRHRNVVDLLRIPDLAGIREDDGIIDLGAACSFSEIRKSPLVTRHLPLLVQAAATIGGWQIQNRATIGGNIANASPAGDSLPVLLVLDARLVLAGPAGTRIIPYDSMHTSYRETALQKGELITRIRIPCPEKGSVQQFRKVGTRQAQAISKVVLAFHAYRSAGRLTRVRVAAGSVAPIPLRLRTTEAVLEGQPPTAGSATNAARTARAEVKPLDDIRSSAAYRSFVLGRLVRRMVLAASE